MKRFQYDIARLHHFLSKYNFSKVNFIFLLTLYVPGVYGQNTLTDRDITNQLWLSYNMSYNLTQATNLTTEVGFKTIFPNVWNRYYLKPEIRVSLPKIMFKKEPYSESLHAGIGLYYTNNINEANRLEVRPYQGYLLDWPDWPRFRLRHFIRLEERFDINTQNWLNTFGLRLRYLLDVTFKLQGDIVPEAKGIYIPMSIEFFWNLIGVKQFNDVQRTNIGIGSTLSQSWRAEFRFGYQYTRNTTTEDFSTNDIIYQAKVYYIIR